MNSQVAIYVCLDGDGFPRYVGKTINPTGRRAEHRRERDWFSCFFILEWVSQSLYKKRENAWILYFKALGFPLENKNNGGGGLAFMGLEQRAKMRTKKLSQETKLKISRSHTGKKRTPEHQARLNAANKVSQTGKKRHPDAIEKGREKIRKSTIKQWVERRSNGYTVSEETKSKTSASLKKKWSEPGQKEKWLIKRKRSRMLVEATV